MSDRRVPDDLTDVPVDELVTPVVERLERYRVSTLVEPPADLAARIHARVGQEQRPAPWWRTARFALVLASTVLDPVHRGVRGHDHPSLA